MKRILAVGTLAFAMTVAGRCAATDAASFWHASQASPAVAHAPSHYMAYTLDLDSLKRQLAASPARLDLPGPDGVMHPFDITPASALPAALAAKYPDIRSYQGSDGQGRRVRLDLSPKGLKAAVYGDPKGVWLVQRATTLGGDAGGPAADGDVYWSFARNDLPSSPANFREGGVHREGR